MALKVFLQKPHTAKVKIGILGFSWTTFFFGLFVPLFRKDWKVFLFFFLIYMATFYFMPYTYTQIDGMSSFMITDQLGIYSTMSTIFYFVVNILGAFFYNQFYTKALVKKGYRPLSHETEVVLKRFGITAEAFYPERNDEEQ